MIPVFRSSYGEEELEAFFRIRVRTSELGNYSPYPDVSWRLCGEHIVQHFGACVSS